MVKKGGGKGKGQKRKGNVDKSTLFKPGKKVKGAAKSKKGDKVTRAEGQDAFQNAKEKRWRDKKNAPAKKVVLTREDRKQLRKERRAAKPNAEVVGQANSLWGVSLRSLKKEARYHKIGDMLDKIKGKIMLVCAKHDGSRVLEYVVKYCSPEQRKQVFEEIRGSLLHLAQHTYGHFVVLKVLQYGDAPMKQAVADAFAGKVEKLSLHATCAKVMDYLYMSSEPATQCQLLSELYGREFAVFRELGSDAVAMNDDDDDDDDDDNSDKHDPRGALKRLLAKYPLKREGILGHLKVYIDRMIEKQQLMFRYLHTVMLQFLEEAGPSSEQGQWLMGLLRTHLMALHHSEHGVELACQCIAYGSAKDRKALVKAIKGYVVDLAEHVDGYMILLRLLNDTDDTVLLRKGILEELSQSFGEGPEAMLRGETPKIFMQLCAPGSGSYFTPEELRSLERVSIEKEVDGQVKMVPTSRKDADTRQTELLRKFLSPLLNALDGHCDELLRDSQGSQVVLEVLREASVRAGTDGFDSVDGLVSGLLAQIGALCQEQEVEKSVLDDASAHLVIKRLLGVLPEARSQELGECLLESIENGPGVEAVVASNRGAFVVEAMMQKAGDGVRGRCAKALEGSVDVLSGGDASAGRQALAKLIGGSGSSKKKSKRKAKKR